jgi:hypothetical protein
MTSYHTLDDIPIAAYVSYLPPNYDPLETLSREIERTLNRLPESVVPEEQISLNIVLF